MKRHTIILALALSGITGPSQTVHSPDMPSGNTAIFGPIQSTSGRPTVRYQQVFSRSDFSSMEGGAYLTQIAFNYQFQVAPFPGGAVASNIQVKVSTTQKSVDGLSATFADNIGSDETMVYGIGPVIMPPNDRPGFDVFIAFTTPFLYNPQAGNLLLEILNFGGFGGIGGPIADPPFFDAHDQLGDSVSRLWGDNVNASVGGLDSIGLLTQFTFVPIPEPTPLAILALGIAGLLARLRLEIKGKR